MTSDFISLANWEAITKAFDLFALPRLEFDEDLQPAENLWAFRGHKSNAYDLKPTIEREAEAKGKSIEWRTLESLVLEEFRSKARMHADPATLPPPEDKLSWLALMQHYTVPTRLLDFT